MTTLYTTAGTPVQVYDSTGRLVWGEAEPPAPPEPVTPPVGPTRIIATRCSLANIGRAPSSADGTHAVTEHVLTVDTATATLEWDLTPGFSTITTGGVIRASIQVPGRTPTPLTWDGADHITIPNIQGSSFSMAADPVEIQARAGTALRVHAWIDPDTTGNAPADLTSLLPSDPGRGTGAWTTTPTTTPVTDQGAVLTGGHWSLRPSRILASSDQPAWIVVGDSIMQQAWSFGERAIDALGLAGTKSAQGGDAYLYQASRFPVRVAPSAPYVTGMVDEFGINDTGRTWDVMASDALKYWRMARDSGIGTIVKTTLTLGGAAKERTGLDAPQTGNRELFNDWLRDGAPLALDLSAPAPAGTVNAVRCQVIRPDGTITPGSGDHLVSAVSDVVAVIESTPNSGRYSDSVLPLVGGDSLHPAAGIHAILADRLTRDLGLLGY